MLKQSIVAVFALFLSSVLFFPVSKVDADDNVGFSVGAQLPENQLDTDHSYFDLRMHPGQQQDIQTIIYNHEQNDITVKVSVYNAFTNSNGLIVYEDREETDPSLKHPITDLVSLKEKKVTIPAEKSVSVTASLDMPEEEFDGIKLGGLHFEKVPDDEIASKGVNVQNKYAYVIGLQLSENNNEVTPKLQLRSVKPTVENHRTAVVAKLRNIQPALAENMRIRGKVFKKKGEKPIKELEKANVNMAPNSDMDVVIDWENNPLEEGYYRLELQASNEKDEWKWEKVFTIGEEAKDFNKEAVELETNNNRKAWYIAGISVLIIIILILLVYIWRLKRTGK
ncbi:DUF916 and DUF3324 domain-containing protein [Lentibacillus cibarius]|uniref:DUF916 and DUF3324 domain-containing protein n=1 Tax=Lentibacillus cibarius TaxID=2583219 RepID=A0A549YBH6_9BACI|nr:DUF916 and DUF3324 domain-containing protein [Lentibacillus cibarius]TRM09238.1 DUF916 and DUF3324 domain-containing protein [Lentibacillus cibarius]TRM11520.1 DUF916 and DUF3324 domain-containing protein [Lentibacillus cibarius]